MEKKEKIGEIENLFETPKEHRLGDFFSPHASQKIHRRRIAKKIQVCYTVTNHTPGGVYVEND